MTSESDSENIEIRYYSDNASYPIPLELKIGEEVTDLPSNDPPLLANSNDSARETFTDVGSLNSEPYSSNWPNTEGPPLSPPSGAHLLQGVITCGELINVPTEEVLTELQGQNKTKYPRRTCPPKGFRAKRNGGERDPQARRRNDGPRPHGTDSLSHLSKSTNITQEQG
ncbi:hypothetical protein AVEN_7995-1 [Araneus ventricosus]|uniref:Uncharacterized protein n=1 Tax=Araneus ventricosus TaxID=182803 RepID=A0A4Y2W343_ARAVE|nr:hypothetical protein AVEN_7995-1 [Araneus ventricosus]